MEFSGYTVKEKIHDGRQTKVYRAVKDGDASPPLPVIIKVLKNEHPGREEITRLKNEYEIAKNLEIKGIVKPYELIKHKAGSGLVLEDFNGSSLKNIMKSERIELEQFLWIAIRLSEIFEQIHSKNIIHKDIKPQNIIINSEKKVIKITGFGISSFLTGEEQNVINVNLPEGTLAYMAPEQTGKMNRFTDYRSDYYSLGVVLYEMATGHLPFPAKDPLELIHCQIAKNPVPPHETVTEFPLTISRIIMKLLSKTAEDRYQSGHGLKADLIRCLSELKAGDGITDFEPGGNDKSFGFRISEKLYGRETEISTLEKSINRIINGAKEFTLIAGYSGIGKTSLVQEIQRFQSVGREYYITGKFDLLQRDMPYSAVIKAFKQLIGRILTENKEQMRKWKKKILTAVGPNGQIIIDILPRLEHIIGRQNPILDLSPEDSLNRFNLVLQNFVSVVANREHPLTIFLDDLQWADPASLQLLQTLAASTGIESLHLIGAYRDNEVDAAHPLQKTLEKLRKSHVKINTITLKPLREEHVQQMVAGSLGREMKESVPLANLIYGKTGGNPFFVNEFLKSLYRNELISFNLSGSQWEWNLNQIEKADITDNVADLMMNRFRNLTNSGMDILKLAACIGSFFTLNTLAIVNKKDRQKTVTAIWEAVREGLILPLNEKYKYAHATDDEFFEDIPISFKFSHDRVQQAAYALLSEEEKQNQHLKIGTLLLEKTNGEQRNESICEIMDHLNVGIPLVKDQNERNKMAGLNLTAGRKARASMAYESALFYLSTGIKLMSPNAWKTDYKLTLSLHLEGAESAYLSINYPKAETLTKIVLNEAADLLDKVKAYEIIIQSYRAQSRFNEAISAAVNILKQLGVSLPAKPGKLHIILGLLKTMLVLRGKSVENLYSLPRMTDPKKLAAMSILRTSMFSIFGTMREMFPLIAFATVRLSAKYGNSSASPCSYAMYGLVLGGIKDIEMGYRIGSMAIDLTRNFEAQKAVFRAYILFYTLMYKWKDSLTDTLKPLDEIYQAAFEAGDFESTAILARVFCTNLLYSGGNLERLEQVCAKNDKKLKIIKEEDHRYSIGIIRQAAINLIGAKYKTRLIGEGFDEEKMLPILIKDNNANAIIGIRFITCMLSYIFEDYSRAFESFRKMEKQHEKSGRFGAPLEVQFYFSLTILAVYSGFKNNMKKRYLGKLNKFQKMMKNWAEHAPMNYLHKWQLIEAERARVMQKESKAMEFYDLAIAGAKTNDYIQEEAIANELAARFYLSRGREKIAHLYMKEAHYCYTKWGAAAKVRDIEEKYPLLLVCPSGEIVFQKEKMHFLTDSTGYKPEVLDLATMIKASQAISGEIILEKLFEKLMRIVIEAAGAEKGFLLLDKEGQYYIRANGETRGNVIKITQYAETAKNRKLPKTVLNYTVRTGESLVLSDSENDDRFKRDSYIMENKPKSILCAPLIHQSKLKGIIYLENNLTAGAFTSKKVELVKLISSQAAISLENALLYQNLSLEITERRNAMKKINRLASIVESTEDGVIGMSTEGIIRSWNPGAKMIYGYVSEKVMGHHISILTAENYTETIKDTLKRIRETGTFEQYETVHITRKGLSIDVSLTISPVRESSGNITDISIISRNITERKRLEQEVLEISVREQKRIGQALHDNLGQQLTGLAYNCKLLEKNLAGKSADEAKLAGEITRNVNRAISHAHGLAVNLFQLEIIPENLIDTLDEMVSGVHSLYDIHVKFEKNIKEPISDSFPATNLFRIAQESINNAVKHAKAKNITIKLLSEKNNIVLSVSDDGSGFIESQSQGEGIGLRIMRYRAGMMRASFNIRSDPGRGTIVTLRVPIK